VGIVTQKIDEAYNLSGFYPQVKPTSHRIPAEGAGKSLTNGAKMTTNKALDAADDFLGEGYKEVAPGVFRSKDGLRQVRMTDADITGAHGGGAHMNFETGKSITNPNGRVTFKVNDNIHIYLADQGRKNC
jgi:hypothetical protein